MRGRTNKFSNFKNVRSKKSRSSNHTEIRSKKLKNTEISQDGRNIPSFGRENLDTNQTPRPGNPKKKIST